MQVLNAQIHLREQVEVLILAPRKGFLRFAPAIITLRTSFLTIAAVFVLLMTGSGAPPVFGQSVRSIPYKSVAGIDPQLTTLDVYSLDSLKRAPVVVLVHGGSWHSGDKSHFAEARNLQEFFRSNGILTVAINMRLVKEPRSPGTTYREQASDVASAIRWVHDNIANYGGNPNNISLLGFSSGAHLVALIGTDDRYLQQQGLSLSSVRSVMAFDVDAYDIPLAIREAIAYGWPAAISNLPNIFSNDVNAQKDASPVNFISSAKHHPPFLVVYSGILRDQMTQQLSKRQSEIFVEALKRKGVPASVAGSLAARHVELMMRLGRPDFGLTNVVKSFVDSYVRHD
jgi:arylformamidase